MAGQMEQGREKGSGSAADERKKKKEKGKARKSPGPSHRLGVAKTGKGSPDML